MSSHSQLKLGWKGCDTEAQKALLNTWHMFFKSLEMPMSIQLPSNSTLDLDAEIQVYSGDQSAMNLMGCLQSSPKFYHVKNIYILFLLEPEAVVIFSVD